MPPKYDAGLEALRAAQQGASRLEQYVVEEPAKIVEEVTEDEYRRIVEQRRGEFVVGKDDLGYEDTGKEIWEGAEAARERAAERRAAEGAGSRATAKAKSTPAVRPPAGGAAQLHQLLQAGAHAGGAGSATVIAPAGRGDASRQKELDDMLQQMCGQIDAGAMAAPTPAASASGVAPPSQRPQNGKRKADAGVGAATSSKKVSTKKDDDVPMAVVNEPLPAATVKRELSEGDAPAVCVAAKVKAEPTDDMSAIVKPARKVKREVKGEPGESDHVMRPEATGAAQMRAWLQGGVCEGVTVDATLDDAGAVGDAGAQAAQASRRLLLEEDGGLWFFFLDAFEDDRASPPRLYLFGKIRVTGQTYESCCLVVERVERCVHLLLNVDDLDDDAAVQETARKAELEFDRLCHQQCPGVKKLRAKLKYRNYAFEKALKYGNGELPFLKVILDSTGQMPNGNMSGESFSHIFGAQTSQAERFLTQKRIMGPSWLRLRAGGWREDPAKLSHCAIELRITPASIATPKTDEARRELTAMGMPTSSPPLRMLSISMQTLQRSPQQPHEPLAISCTLHPRLNADAPESDRDLRDGLGQWAAVRRLDPSRPLPRDPDNVLPRNGVETFQSEVAMLNALLAKIHEFDPDVIAGHSAYGFDLDVLATRMHQLKVHGWQKFGRLRRPKDRVPHLEGSRGAGFWVGSSLAAGRLVCDVALQAKDLLPKIGAHDLVTLMREHLGVTNMHSVEPEALPKYYDTSSSLTDLVEMTFTNALAVARLAHSLQILPLTKQLTNLAGNSWNASLQNKRAERNEMLLCHEFHRRKFVLPDREHVLAKKRRAQQQQHTVGLDDPEDAEAPAAGAGPRRGKAAYSGGLVLEPKVGLYDDFVMLLDFNSLYPSIIQEHNICFTTVDRPNEELVAQCGSEAELLAKTHQPDGLLDEGVLPQVLRRLVETRRNVKGAIKSERDARRRQMLEIRQMALKLTANSMYGCLGFQNSRFYAKPLAALITARGRDALQTAISVVQQELQLEVVYGDTDSVFVNTKTQDYWQAMQAAQQIKASVNKKYKRLEIEIDAVFGRLMLLKKKKYAALKVVDWDKKHFEQELKGLDIVRRDWCEFAKTTGHDILDKLLAGEGKEEAVHWVHDYLQSRGKEMDEQRVPLQRYVITKGLTKDPRDYPDAKNQPHVQVALRLLQRGKAIRPGQEIGYVVCEPAEGAGAKAPVSERARHPHELQLDPTLRVDVEWYKRQQVHPLVSRLLAPVEGTDAARIAECLGLDGARFAQAAAAREAAEGGEDASYARLASNDVNALFDRKVRWKNYASRIAGVQCPKCQETTSWQQLLQPEAWEANGVSAMFRCSKCPELVKPKRAQNLFTVQMRSLLREHCEGWVQCAGEECIEKTRRLTCGQNMTGAHAVLRELEFMEYLCEAEACYAGEDHRGCREAAAGMKRTVRWLLETNGFNWVDCKQIFSGIFGDR
mmetsp:Transcript_29229/g.84657  ORF Transcript_29229/g.84657 Transcript_29229/m.84657 type:complete len:1463 (-) Transcript_29229:143-4531(-)